jgi:hypothetical protein
MPGSAAFRSVLANAAGMARSKAPMIAAPASETLRIETLPLIVKKGPLEGEITPSVELRQRAVGEVRTRTRMGQMG